MSDHIVKLIPCMHTYRTNVNAGQAAAAALGKIVEADEITFEQPDHPEFVGCGSNLKKICCPRCGAEVDQTWWKQKMEEMCKQDHFFVLEQEMPCCGKTVSFNNLRYDAPCGFATMLFTIRNPKAEVEEKATNALSERFGLLFRKVEFNV